MEEIQDYPLSDNDIRQILGQEIRIMTYPELKHLRSIDQCFDSKGRCILLFLTSSPTDGHWCCMMNKPDGIHFFDPYGESPEDVKGGVSMPMREQLDMRQPYLTRLLRASGRPVFYNTVPYQQEKSGVNTCGRWCVVRLMYAPKSDAYFHKVVQKAYKKGMTPDTFVSGLTANWIGK